jgi:thioredoxin-related protein
MFFRSFLLFLIIAALTACGGQSMEPIRHQGSDKSPQAHQLPEQKKEINVRSLYDAVEESEDTGKPLVIYFYAEDCAPCALMETEVWTDPTIVKIVNDLFVFTAIDVEKFPKESPEHEAVFDLVVKKFKVRGTPATVVVKTSNEPNVPWTAATIMGYSDPNEFIETLMEATLMAVRAQDRLIEEMEKDDESKEEEKEEEKPSPDEGGEDGDDCNP